MAATNGAALPSMIGASGPSISTKALSTPSPDSAANTCSAVDTSGPDASPSTVANSVAVTAFISAQISQSCRPSMRVRMNRRPLPASAGCNVRGTGKPELAPTPGKAVRSRSVGCLATFILPVPHSRPAYVESTLAICTPAVYGTRLIMRATTVAFLPSVRLHIPAGKVSAALSPDENPFDLGSLAAGARKSNSRFFTDCYHQAAAIGPPDGRKARGALLARVLRAVPIAQPGGRRFPKLIC